MASAHSVLQMVKLGKLVGVLGAELTAMAVDLVQVGQKVAPAAAAGSVAAQVSTVINQAFKFSAAQVPQEQAVLTEILQTPGVLVEELLDGVHRAQAVGTLVVVR